jgi:drug/metabolite transporter (DMT)-like permease
VNDVTKGILAAVIASAIWGGMYVISRIVLEVFPPVTLVSIRMAVSAATILLFYALTGREWRLPRNVWARVALMGVIGYTISISAQFAGTALAGAALGSLITTAAPLVTVAISAAFGLERISPRAWFGTGLGAVALLVLYALGGGSSASPLGILWLLVAAVSWGILGIIGAGVVRDHDPFLVTGWASVVGCIGTLLIVPFELQTRAIGVVTPAIALGILYLGIISTAIAFALWVYGVAKAGSVLSGIAFFAQPLVGSLLGALLLGENLGWSFALAAGLLFVAALLSRPESTCDEATLEARL